MNGERTPPPLPPAATATGGEARLGPVAWAGGRVLAEPRPAPDGTRVAFVERAAGATRLVVVPVHAGSEAVVAEDPPPAARGGVVEWLPDGRSLAYVTRDGSVAVVPVAGGPPRLVAEGAAAALAVAPDGRRLAFVDDTRAVTVVPLDGGPPRVVSEGADFALDPCWSPDGRRLAWHEWDVPDMPWDAGRIMVAPADGGAPPAVVAGGPGVGVQQPRFSPDGTALAFVSDATGWANVWVAGPDGAGARPLVAEEHEHAGPAWGPGQRSFAWSPDSAAVAFWRNEAGFGRLCVAGLDGDVRALSKGVHAGLSWTAGGIVGVRSGARTPPALALVDARSGAARRLAVAADAEVERVAARLPEPEVVRWRAPDGAEVPGRLWRPSPDGPPPPLLVRVHGGPTGQDLVDFDVRTAFFLERGWAVLAPDHRGSTGWGRAWAQALRGRWGDLDVEDVAAGARAAVARGWADPRRLVVTGASAGGMTALLLAARHPDLWAAVVAVYPVVDLLDLAASTHRYEAHYTVGLVGPLPETADLHRARSPLALADAIGAPVLLLHGAADEVVPPAQSAVIAEQLAAAGVPVERRVYEGEGHGWRQAATLTDELERTEAFLASHAGRRGAAMGR